MDMRYIPGPEECENVEGYGEGGFHPTVIGDRFHEDRYTVVHKLGYGGFATVWLVRDHQEERYAALKIQTADCSAYSAELEMYHYLQQNGPEEYEKTRAIPLFDSFYHEGPNGVHLCLVFEVLGPSLASLLQGATKKIRPDVARKIARDMAVGLMELHQSGVVYGDLSAGNVLFRLADDFDSLSTDELYERFGHPEPIEMAEAVMTNQDEDGCGHYERRPCEGLRAPPFIYMPIDFAALSDELLKPEIRFIDLGETYVEGTYFDPEEGPGGFGVNFSYADPESLWWSQRPEQASDIWALACIWYEMRTARVLFEQSFGGPSTVRNGIINTIGPIPQPWLDHLRRVDEMEKKAMHCEEDSDVEAADESSKSAVPTIWERLISIWTWVRDKCQISQAAAPDNAAEELERLDKDAAREQLLREAAEKLDSLSKKINRVGQWKPWCYLTVEERIEKIQYIRRYEGKDSDDDSDGLRADTGNAPPSPLSDDEAADMAETLLSMLTYTREGRGSLKEVIDKDWLTKEYPLSEVETGPWLQQFHEGFSVAIWDSEKGESVTVF
jgi:serine/threonine-protein kinase SRPK3